MLVECRVLRCHQTDSASHAQPCSCRNAPLLVLATLCASADTITHSRTPALLNWLTTRSGRMTQCDSRYKTPTCVTSSKET